VVQLFHLRPAVLASPARDVKNAIAGAGGGVAIGHVDAKAKTLLDLSKEAVEVRLGGQRQFTKD